MTTMRSTTKSLVMAGHCWGVLPRPVTQLLFAVLKLKRSVGVTK